MWIDDDEYIIRCGCGDVNNNVWLGVDTGHFEGDEYQVLDIGMNIDDAGFWGRIRNAIKYIFKNKKFWNYGTISLDMVDPRERGEVKGLIAFLQRVVDGTEIK